MGADTQRRVNEVVESEVRNMPDIPNIIIPLCDADYCAISKTGQIGRDVLTIADLEEMYERGMTY